MQELEQLLDIEELADKLKKSVSTIYSNYISWKIPYVKIGGDLRFSPSDVSIWLENKRNIGKHIKNKKRTSKKCQSSNQKGVNTSMLILPTKNNQESGSPLEKLLKEKRGLNMKKS
jgi:predicted DNA-binding transcriptional regulator AlpA